jgi:polyhydroxybutyrate depolymerase
MANNCDSNYSLKGSVAPFVLLLMSVALLLLSCGGGRGSSGSSGSCDFQAGGNCSITVNGVARSYVLHLPPGYQANSSALVIALHGSQQSGAEMQTISELSNKADQVGFAVAYPDALKSNEGHTLWSVFYNDFAFTGTPPEDVAFLRQLINTLQANIHPDPKKIYICGFSIGGYMAHRAGVQLSDLVAAIGVVEGTLYAIATTDSRSVPASVAPVSVIIFHGDQDSGIPYCGSMTPTVNQSSQDQTFNYWTSALADNCSTLDTTVPLCDSQGKITSVAEKDATNCRSNAEVKFYKLVGGVHAWYNTRMDIPGQVPYNPKLSNGTGTSTDDVLWNFFAGHPKS